MHVWISGAFVMCLFASVNVCEYLCVSVYLYLYVGSGWVLQLESLACSSIRFPCIMYVHCIIMCMYISMCVMCMYMSMCAYLYLCLNVYIYVCMYMSMCVYLYLCLNVYIYVCMYMSICVYLYLCVNVYNYVCMNMYVSVCLWIPT